MKIKKLENVGVEILDIDITKLTNDQYIYIKELLVEELIVLIRNQEYKNPYYFARLISSVGNIGNIGTCNWHYPDGDINFPVRYEGEPIQPQHWKQDTQLYPVQRVTGNKNTKGVITGIFGTGTLTWHSNLNNPKNAAGVALQAIAGVKGTSTSFMDTTAVYNNMDEKWRKRCENVVGHFRYTPEIWAEGLPAEQHRYMLASHLQLFKTLDYQMPLLNKNVSKSKTGLFFHFNNNCSFPTDPELLEDLKNLCLQEKYIYQHWWEPGDIILMEQRLTLHKRDQDDPEILKDRLLHRYTFSVN
jgi:alpha-ketoglutarate-dependent taurine dioxygenase